MDIKSIILNPNSNPSRYTVVFYYSDNEGLQRFNYGIDQTLPLRKSPSNYEKYYINQEFKEDSCLYSSSCYGGGNSYTEEVRACDETKYYKYDTCQSFPTTPKNKYFSLTLPLKDISATSTGYLSYSNLNLETQNTGAFKEGKITYTFWIKLIGYRGSKEIFQFGLDSNP